jgi:hypothetical protein
MNDRFNPSDEQLDALVKARLEERASEIDPQPLIQRLQERLADLGPADDSAEARLAFPAVRGRTGASRNRGPVLLARRRWTVAVAAAMTTVALGVIGIVYLRPSSAGAATLVLASKHVHELPLDRCYLVQVQPVPDDQTSKAPAPRRVDRLWTRGDRFFIESSNDRYRWAWGQDAAGAVWLAAGRRRGLRLEASEVPPWLRSLCDTHSMEFETLLGQLLQNFHLTWEASDATTLPQTRVVYAIRKPGHRENRVVRARLEIDVETKVIRRLVVRRWSRGGTYPRRLVTTTYTLVGSEARSDLCYQPEGHLDEPFVIYTREHEPETRFEILSRLYGLRLSQNQP